MVLAMRRCMSLLTMQIPLYMIIRQFELAAGRRSGRAGRAAGCGAARAHRRRRSARLVPGSACALGPPGLARARLCWRAASRPARVRPQPTPIAIRAACVANWRQD